jgi:4-hydroxybenzoate polyprenyltransferase
MTSIYEAVIPDKLQFLFALSRTHHGVLDMMAPIFAALVTLGHLPDPATAIVGIITVFAGYTCVYALNDIAGFHDDRKNIRVTATTQGGSDLDSILIRHPLAQGVISVKSAVLWAGFWAGVAGTGAFYLNPVCLLIFFSGAALEVVYCLLLKVSFLRIVITGFVKSAGPVAAVFAVDSTPDPALAVSLFAFFFLWEAGGQNIPNDYTDMAEDRMVRAKTLPLKFGRDRTCRLIMGLLIACSVVMALAFFLSPVSPGAFSWLAFIAATVFLLILPAARLLKTKSNDAAMTLFNRASYYPVFLLCVVLFTLFF